LKINLKKVRAFLNATIIILAFFLINGNALAAYTADDQYGIYYRNSRIFGKLIHYDPDRDLGIVYGSVFVSELGGEWRLIESRKFHLVNPIGNDMRENIIAAVGKTIGVEGELKVWPGLKEEVLVAKSIELQDYPIEIPPWFAFGKTIRTEKIFKFNLNNVTDFVNVLAGLQHAAGIPQKVRLTGAEVELKTARVISPSSGEREFSTLVKNEFEKKWNEKWCVAKDKEIANELRAGVGGWQFYQGVLGFSNSYISNATVIRKDITAFMDAVRAGGSTPVKSGQATMCAFVTVSRDRYGSIKQVTVSGALYDSVPGLLEAMKNPVKMNLETWRMEGWDQDTAEMMEGKLCWLSGNRILVYETDPKTGKSRLVDQYFALDRHLTREGFENVLDIGKGIIGEGGI